MSSLEFQRSSQPHPNRRELALIIAFGLFSFVLLSLWGALVAGNLGVVFSPRRMVVCSLGAGIFWLTLRRLKQQGAVSLGTLLVSIIVAGLSILAVRLGIDQMAVAPIEPEHSVRWTLAWSGYFGIWLLASVPPCPPQLLGQHGDSAAGRSEVLPEVYLDHLLDLPDDRDRV